MAWIFSSQPDNCEVCQRDMETIRADRTSTNSLTKVPRNWETEHAGKHACSRCWNTIAASVGSRETV